MRQFTLISLLCALCTGRLAADDRFPYVAYISQDKTAAHSGPGKVHYATAYLDRGAQVEVYRHDPGGWCAVRPPSGSFSLVANSHLQLTNEQGIGQVLGENVVAWVGSVNEVVEHLWQVTLREGEFVEILGKEQRTGSAAGALESWYKIAPPAGEFRWIHETYISRQPPAMAGDPSSPVPEHDRSVVNHQEQQLPPSAAAPPLLPEMDTLPAARDGARKPVLEEPTANASAASSPASEGSPQEDFTAQLRAVDVELSRVLAREPETWWFDELRTSATTLVGKAVTDLQRGQARLLVEKIGQFEELLRRFETVNSLPETFASENDENDQSEPSDPGLITSNLRQPGLVDDIDPRYDGSGILMPVHSRTPGAPAFALMDGDGNVLHYVTPVPGFNLNRYVRLEIGVYGQRGYIPHLNVPHLTAQRVVVLDRHRR